MGSVVVGLPELGRALDLIPVAVGKRIIRRAVRSGARVFWRQIKDTAPRDTGELQSQVTIRITTVKDQSIGALVGIRYRGKVARYSRRPGKVPSTEDPGVYAIFLEYGRPGVGRPGYRGTGHTHQAAQPFMRPAFDTKKDEALRVVAEELERGIEEEVKKLPMRVLQAGLK